MSDWNDTIKPVASKLYADLRITHAMEVGALVEALEIARRRAEIDQTEKEWCKRHGFDLERARGNMQAKSYLKGANLIVEAANLFKTLCNEFGPQRAVHVLTAIEREHARQRWASDLQAWRARGEMSTAQAAAELGLSIEDVEAIEGGTFSAGPAAMRLVRPALRRVRGELADHHQG